MIENSNVLTFKKNKSPVRCVCPRCGITHILNFFWSGKGTPRKFCHRCRGAVSDINDQYIYEASPDVFHLHNKGVSSQSNDD